jgi:DNA-binding NarL/FixJ family response regulator
VLEASNGLEAIEVFEQQSTTIALIVSDLGMPKVNGLGLLRKVMEMKPSTKVMIASGFVDPSQRSEILRIGAREIIQKPYNSKQILQRVREILDLRT